MDIEKKILSRQDEDFNKKLKIARLAILGTGGLGSNIAMMLARSGLGNIILFDYDRVEYSNLNRQNFTLDDLGREKVEATKEKIKAVNPFINVTSHNVKLDKDNIYEYLDLADIFIEAFDDEKNKAMVFDVFSEIDGKYLIGASGISGFEEFLNIECKRIGNISIFGDFKSQVDEGLYSPKVMLYASLQACEALNIINKIY